MLSEEYISCQKKKYVLREEIFYQRKNLMPQEEISCYIKNILVICDVLVLRVTVILLKSLFIKMWYNLRRKPVHLWLWAG